MPSGDDPAVVNPYGQMNQEKCMSEDRAGGTGGTPWHLWVVGILSLLWNAMGAYDYLMTETQNPSYMSGFTPEQLEYFYGFPAWVVGFWAVAVWGGVLGSVFLLLRKKLAVGVFLVSFLCMVVTTIHNFGLSDGLEVMGGPGALAFSAVIFVVGLLLYFYAKGMRNRGVLV